MKGNKQRLLIKNVVRLRDLSRRYYCDILPTSKTTIIRQKYKENESNLKEQKDVEKQPENVSKEFRVNDVNIQMISKNIYDQLFKTPSPRLDPKLIKR